MFEPLADKVAIVTGCARGIGRAIALLLARHKNCVVANDISECVKNVGDEIRRYDGQAITFQGDISSQRDVEKLKEVALATFDKIDILVNNAGIHQHLKVEELSLEDWNRILKVNLTGAFLCSKAVIPEMKKQRYGRIVNISSIDGFTGTDHEVHYGSSKAGIIGLTKCLALELASYNITVNAIAPGDIMTDMLMPINDEKRRILESAIPLGLLGKPEDIAKVVLFLVSNMADFITGETIHVNGGSLMI